MPPPSDEYDLIVPDPNYATSPDASPPETIQCDHKTQYVHRSGPDISVHGQTRCTAPVALIKLNVALKKQRCVFIFCWWSERASTGFRASSANWSSFEVPLHIVCESGYWGGVTVHSITLPPGYQVIVGRLTATTTSYNALRVDRC